MIGNASTYQFGPRLEKIEMDHPQYQNRTNKVLRMCQKTKKQELKYIAIMKIGSPLSYIKSSNTSNE